MSRPSLSGIWGVRETLEPLNSKDASQRKPYYSPSNVQKLWNINIDVIHSFPIRSHGICSINNHNQLYTTHVYSPFQSWGVLWLGRTEHAQLNPKIDSAQMINFCFFPFIIIMSDLYVFLQRERPKILTSQK